MHILLTDSSSILGSALAESFFNSGHSLNSCPHLLSRSKDIKNILQKNQAFDMVMLVDGSDIFNTNCTKATTKILCAEQIKATKRICNYFAHQTNQPKIIFSVSSASHYTSEHNEPVFEMSNRGSGFAADYFKELEAATFSAEESGIRVVHLRLGKVISRSTEPVIPKLPFLNKYIPSVFHDKNRLVSWVSLEDAVRAIHFIEKNEEISGPVNIVSGDTVTRAKLISAVAKKFNLRKTPPLPPLLIQILFGHEGTCLLETGSRTIPLKLMEAGFLFENISLQEYFQETS